jgi:uncharacterized Tic20 family protein
VPPPSPSEHICIPIAAVNGAYTQFSPVAVLQHPISPAVGHVPPLPFWTTQKPLPDALNDAAQSVAQYCCVQLSTAVPALVQAVVVIIAAHLLSQAESLQAQVGMHWSHAPHAPPAAL